MANTIIHNKRRKDLKTSILNSILNSGKGHVGGAFSVLDILMCIYYDQTNVSMIKEKNKSRDRIILSKGHAAIALYAILQDLDFFNKSELMRMNNCGILGEHPDKGIPGIEVDSGSLGHGLSLGVGISLASKLDNLDYYTYVILGDGECYEGTVWEAANLASHHNLGKLICFVDRNRLCIHGDTEDVNKLEPFSDKWQSFGWNVYNIDGHNQEQINLTISNIKNNKSNKPNVIIANTIKGKGVSFMENSHKWHHGGLSKEVYDLCISEIEQENL